MASRRTTVTGRSTSTTIDVSRRTITIDGVTLPIPPGTAISTTTSTTTTTTTATSASAGPLITTTSSWTCEVSGDDTMGLADKLRRMTGKSKKKQQKQQEQQEQEEQELSATQTQAGRGVRDEGAQAQESVPHHEISPRGGADENFGATSEPTTPHNTPVGGVAASPTSPMSKLAANRGAYTTADNPSSKPLTSVSLPTHTKPTHTTWEKETTFPSGPSTGGVSSRPTNLSSAMSPQRTTSPHKQRPTSLAMWSEADVLASISSTHVCVAGITATFPTVECTIIVENISPEKRVTIRASSDNWVTHQDVPATWQASLADGRADKFHCTFSTIETRPQILQICCKYETNGHEYWDSNKGMNYTLDFDAGTRTTAALPSTHAHSVIVPV